MLIIAGCLEVLTASGTAGRFGRRHPDPRQRPTRRREGSFGPTLPASPTVIAHARKPVT